MTFLVDIFHTGINVFPLTCIIVTPIKIEKSSITISVECYEFLSFWGSLYPQDSLEQSLVYMCDSSCLQDVVLEYIKQPELKYLRALGCAYLRITARRGSDGDADIPGSQYILSIMIYDYIYVYIYTYHKIQSIVMMI